MPAVGNAKQFEMESADCSAAVNAVDVCKLICKEGNRIIYQVDSVFIGDAACKDDRSKHAADTWDLADKQLCHADREKTFRFDVEKKESAVVMTSLRQLFAKAVGLPLRLNQPVPEVLQPVPDDPTPLTYVIAVTSKKTGRGPAKAPRKGSQSKSTGSSEPQAQVCDIAYSLL